MPVQETTAGKSKASAGRMSAENSMIKFLTNKSPEAAVNLLTACAATGEECWRTMVDAEMAEKLASDKSMFLKFINNMCKLPGSIYAGAILDEVLGLVPKTALDDLFTGPDLKKKSHPASTCFYNASFCSASGVLLTKVLEVLIKHGMPVASVAAKNIADLERAASFGHREFLKIVVPSLPSLHDDVIKAVMVKSMYPMVSISILVDECGIPLSLFASQRILSMAKPEARAYVNARLTRLERIPEMPYNDIDSLDEMHE